MHIHSHAHFGIIAHLRSNECISFIFNMRIINYWKSHLEREIAWDSMSERAKEKEGGRNKKRKKKESVREIVIEK